MLERVFLACIALGIAACTPSIQPVYTKEQLVHDPRVVGVWQDSADSDLYIVARDDEDGYTLTYNDWRKNRNYTAHFARAGNLTFVDLTSLDTTSSSSLSIPDGINLPVHTFGLADFDSTRAVIRVLDPDSLAAFVRGPESRASFLPFAEGGVLLTGSANEVQQIVSRYLERNRKVDSSILRKLPDNIECSAVSSQTYDLAPRGGTAGGNMYEAGIFLRSVSESETEVTVNSSSAQMKSHLRFLEIEGLYVKQEEKRTLNADSSFLAVTDSRTGFRYDVRWNGLNSNGAQRIQVAVCPERFGSTRSAIAAGMPVAGPLIMDTPDAGGRAFRGTLTWSAVPGATAYEVQAVTCLTGLPHCWSRWVVRDTSFRTQHTWPNQWRVRAILGNAGFGRLSPIHEVNWPTR